MYGGTQIKIIVTMYEAIVGWHIQKHILKDKNTVKISKKNA